MRNKSNRKYNNPVAGYIITNLAINIGLFYFAVAIFPFSSASPFAKYTWPFYIYLVIWIFYGITFKKYLPFRSRTIAQTARTYTKTYLASLATGILVLVLLSDFNYSVGMLIGLSSAFFFYELFFISVYYAFHEATTVDVSFDARESHTVQETVSLKVHPFAEDAKQTIIEHIIHSKGEKVLIFLKDFTNLFLSSTLVVNTTDKFNIYKASANRYTTIINLKRINDIREINSFFASINDRLPYNGIFVGSFESKSQRKKRILSAHPTLINYVSYTLDYLLRRVMPKLNLTREAYFWITNGRARTLSKAEVYGRAYYSGFEIIKDRKIEGLTYFIARKIKDPIRKETFNYTGIISLPRMGKSGKIIKVYKFRTMHPYSEYLQDYIYYKHNLQEGGKFHHDIRVTTLGYWLRRYWLDELPMLGNLLKGDMKLVGVRPLSRQYFGLYDIQLQQQRVRHKPGLLPPYYADLPKTLEEIQASEKRYLDACEKHGSFLTDIRYFIVIMTNILFKKARSK
jgi:lipopolysaccharide/colanic/teichoic acid biosynthesis glycosyltransferase